VAWRNSLSEYEKRMHRVLEYIDKHLDQPLDLGTLAEVAHFSPFHFHRLFSAWMAETLGDYLRRRKIEVAAMRLVAQPRVPVLHIALSVGFGSAEALVPFGLGSAAHPPLGEHEKPSNALRIAILVR
jgi:AraC family transcriptional regulator